jgi:pimeloyl-ACP methyl ester carboxylesterase
MGDFTVPKARLAEIRIPTLLLHGGKTDERLARAALSATSVIANAEHKVLQGQTHNVSSIALLPALLEFFNR